MSTSKTITTITELTQYINEQAKESGVPGISLVGHVSDILFHIHLKSRFNDFIRNANIDIEFLKKIINNEDYTNCFYSSLETVRRTHSKIGLVVLALLYKDYWDEPDFLSSAMRSFAEISDRTIRTFVKLYESISPNEGFLKLTVTKDNSEYFHDNYNEAVELINRNIFVQTAYTGMANNMPIQGMIWEHTKEYYKYCKEAIAIIDNPLL